MFYLPRRLNSTDKTSMSSWLNGMVRITWNWNSLIPKKGPIAKAAPTNPHWVITRFGTAFNNTAPAIQPPPDQGWGSWLLDCPVPAEERPGADIAAEKNRQQRADEKPFLRQSIPKHFLMAVIVSVLRRSIWTWKCLSNAIYQIHKYSL